MDYLFYTEESEATVMPHSLQCQHTFEWAEYNVGARINQALDMQVHCNGVPKDSLQKVHCLEPLHNLEPVCNNKVTEVMT